MSSNAANSATDRSPNGVKAISICADDYGMDVNVDRAIVDLAHRGRLTATSVLVDANIDRQSAAALQTLAIDIGLHLNFTEKLGDLDSEAVMPLNQLILRAHARLLSRRWVRDNIERQLDRFAALMGRAPDYVDGHLHIHQLPVIREELLASLQARELPDGFWVRDTRAPDLLGSPLAERFKSWVVGHLGMATLVKKASAIASSQRKGQGNGQGIGFNRGFFGVYDFTKDHRPFMQMMAGWLSQSTTGALVMTHPSGQALQGDPIGQARVAEYQALGSDAFGQMLEQKGVKLVRASQIVSSLP